MEEELKKLSFLRLVVGSIFLLLSLIFGFTMMAALKDGMTGMFIPHLFVFCFSLLPTSSRRDG